MGNSEIALSKPLYKEFDSRNGQFINTISRNVLRLNRLAENILDVAKIESNLLKIRKEKFDVNQKVEHVVDNFRNKQKELSEYGDGHPYKYEKNVELIFVAPKVNPVTVEADAVRFEQILSNLIYNAIKFVDKEEGKVTISVDVNVEDANQQNKDRNKKKLTINVRDNGRGIHPDILHNLFHKFISKAEFGSGLGLFISKNIVESHGGKIWAKNNDDGKGATFSFSLPLKD